MRHLMWRLRSSCFSATCAWRSSICVGILANEFVMRDLCNVTIVHGGEGGVCGLQLRADFLREALVCIRVAHKRLHVGYGGYYTAPVKRTVKPGDAQRSTHKRTGHRHGPYAAGQRMPRLPNCQGRWQSWRVRPGVQRREGRIQRSTYALLSAAVSEECGNWDTKHIRSRRE